MGTDAIKHQFALGQVAVDPETFELDVKINEGYQSYGSELLRVSLLSIAGLAAVWLKIYFPSLTPQRHPLGIRYSMIASFICFILSSAAALSYKYFSADSLAYHLTALRRRNRDRPGTESRPSDLVLAKKQEKKRDIRFMLCSKLLVASIACLLLGVACFGAELLFIMQ